LLVVINQCGNLILNDNVWSTAFVYYFANMQQIIDIYKTTDYTISNKTRVRLTENN